MRTQPVGKVGTQAHLCLKPLAPTRSFPRAAEGGRTLFLLGGEKTRDTPNGSPGIRLRPAHPRAGAGTLHHPPRLRGDVATPQEWMLGLFGVFWSFPSPLCKGLGSKAQAALMSAKGRHGILRPPEPKAGCLGRHWGRKEHRLQAQDPTNSQSSPCSRQLSSKASTLLGLVQSRGQRL